MTDTRDRIFKICLIMILLVVFISVFTLWLRFGATFFHSVRELIRTHTIQDDWQIAVGFFGTVSIFLLFVGSALFLVNKFVLLVDWISERG